MNQLISHFAVKGQPAQYSRYGCGHINETYMVTCDSGFVYILQKINKNIFTKPEELMENIAATTTFLAERSDDPRASMHLVLTTDGKTFYKDADGEYWRMYDFVPSTVCMQKAESRCARWLWAAEVAPARWRMPCGQAAIPSSPRILSTTISGMPRSWV